MAETKPRLVTTQWGTPDPRDPGAYPQATSATPMAQWGWEFLRRRSDYRDRWDKLVRPFLDDCGGFEEKAVYRHLEATKLRAMQEGRSFRVLPPWEALHEEFRVYNGVFNGTLDPRLDRPPSFDGISVAEVQRHTGDVKLPEVLVAFDVSLPIDVQLDAARRVLLLRSKQPRRRIKLRIDKFPLYLRLLDFQQAAAPDKEIGAHLFPNQSGEKLRDAIRKTFDASCRWQDDYLVIALHPPDAS
jgi:hypothetical protein